jgi:hypothetical protein
MSNKNVATIKHLTLAFSTKMLKDVKTVYNAPPFPTLSL